MLLLNLLRKLLHYLPKITLQGLRAYPALRGGRGEGGREGGGRGEGRGKNSEISDLEVFLYSDE